ncbi:MAG: exo-alpha-sialidase [Thaumarchaeota archaeon]|nr:exo-alpha-sialidase [Nitrososphaerota archaeon]
MTAVLLGIAFSDVSAQTTGGPALVVHYQLSDMAASGKNVYVTYQQNIGNGEGSSVFFRKSIDGGSSFDKIIPLGNNSRSANPMVATSGNNVYVTWMENWGGQGNSYVMFERSTDGGNTFSTPMRLSNNDGEAGPQKIIASGNSVYLLILYSLQGNTAERVSLLSSHDNGTTFGMPTTVLEDTQTRGSVDMVISEDGNLIYVSGQNSGKCPIDTMNCQYKIFLEKSTNGGTSFEDPITVKTTNQSIAYPIMTTSDGNVYLAWSELMGDNRILFLAKSNDKGSTVSKPVVFSQEIGESSFPQLVANGKNVFLAWDYSNESIILNEKYHNNIVTDSPVSGFFFAKSTDGGSTFSSPVNLSGIAGTSYWSNIASSDNNVFVSWGTKFNDTQEVFIKKSTDNGVTFGNAIKITDSKQNYFQMKAIASGNYVHVAIDSAYPGDDLFLASSDDDGNTFGNLVNLNHEIIVPEFPFAVPILLISSVLSIVFYRIKFRK